MTKSPYDNIIYELIMPLEVKINFNQLPILLPDIAPGVFAIIPSNSEDKIVVASCNEDDDGGQIGEVDPENIYYRHGRGVVKPENVEPVLYIKRGGVHRDFIQLGPVIKNTPLLIGELVIQHY